AGSLGARTSAAGTSGRGTSGPGTKLAAVRSRSIVYRAGMTIRSADVSRATAQATRIASAAGGYVASENAERGRGQRGGPLVHLELKVPAAAYPHVLAELGGGQLGTRVSLTQHAQDVTQAVADTSSRVASARAAISQLRALLGRAGSVGSLLAVQDQINAQESSLEALEAQQRSLSRETSYATVTLVIETRHAAVVTRHRRGGGFVRGLAGGWHALVTVVWAVLTGLGAALPFAVPIALAGWLGYWLRRRLRQRAGPRPAG
ncbi:MAG: DUF4349 domain-containing protein, partial [Actinobacteria bacterium]|nr:DUF4349 domain-containing protein [Actinomycetota bacterium]